MTILMGIELEAFEATEGVDDETVVVGVVMMGVVVASCGAVVGF